MGILPAVLPDPGEIAPNIPRTLLPLIKGGGKELHKADLPVKEPFQGGIQSLLRLLHIPSRKDSPALGNGVDLALLRILTSQGFSIIIPTPEIPPAVPSLFRRPSQLFFPLPAEGLGLPIPPKGRQGPEAFQHNDGKPGEPYALSLSAGPHLVHSVVPIPCPHFQQSMLSRSPLQHKG